MRSQLHQTARTGIELDLLRPEGKEQDLIDVLLSTVVVGTDLEHSVSLSVAVRDRVKNDIPLCEAYNHHDIRCDAKLEVGLVEGLGRRVKELRRLLILRVLEGLDHCIEQIKFSSAEVRRSQLQEQVIHGHVRVGVAQMGEAVGDEL